MENRKNTILLTVIAVATLLVAVVGATFAFFTASGSSTTKGDVTVSTGTAGSSTFGTLTAINIYADKLLFNSKSYLDFSKRYYIICNKGFLSQKVVAYLEYLGYNVTQVLH